MGAMSKTAKVLIAVLAALLCAIVLFVGFAFEATRVVPDQSSAGTLRINDAIKAASANLPADSAANDSQHASTAHADALTAVSADVATSNPVPATAQNASGMVDLPPDYLYIDGQKIHFVDDYFASTAPSEGAGLWAGSDSTTDGSWGYFIGHNPGPFDMVASLHEGDEVEVSDDLGNEHVYTVFSVFDIPNTTYWEQVKPQVEGYGESIVLQTCVPNDSYRIILAD